MFDDKAISYWHGIAVALLGVSLSESMFSLKTVSHVWPPQGTGELNAVAVLASDNHYYRTECACWPYIEEWFLWPKQEKYFYVDWNYYQCFSNRKTINYRKSIESDKIIIDY